MVENADPTVLSVFVRDRASPVRTDGGSNSGGLEPEIRAHLRRWSARAKVSRKAWAWAIVRESPHCSKIAAHTNVVGSVGSRVLR